MFSKPSNFDIISNFHEREEKLLEWNEDNMPLCTFLSLLLLLPSCEQRSSNCFHIIAHLLASKIEVVCSLEGN